MTDRLSPWLISRDTAAEIAFLGLVFGATEQPGSRVMVGERIGHVEIDVAGSALLMFDAGPGWPPTPAHLRIYVDDLRAVLDRAEAAGATVITTPTIMPFGDLVARFRDPAGHRWWIHEHVEDVDPAELPGRFADSGYLAGLSYLSDSLIAEMVR